MISIPLFLVGTALGAGHSWTLRWTTRQITRTSVPSATLLPLMILLQLLPVLPIVPALLLWGVVPSILMLTGYWLGRTAVLTLTLQRK